MIKYKEIREQVLNAALRSNELGLIHGTSGNISVRDKEDNVVAITPSNIAYETMKVEDIAIVDINGKWIDGNFKPSSETPMHTAVLRRRDDINAVVTSSNSMNTNNVITNTMSNVISNNFSGVNETNKLVGNYE